MQAKEEYRFPKHCTVEGTDENTYETMWYLGFLYQAGVAQW